MKLDRMALELGWDGENKPVQPKPKKKSN